MLSLAIGSAGVFAAPQATGSSRAPAVERLSARPAPHAVLQPGRGPQGAVISTPACNDQWNIVPSANAGTNANNELNSVSAISSTDAWAVGDFETGVSPNILRQPQAQHWDGSSWTLPTAQPAVAGTGDNLLLSVTAVTTTNVWAVGYSKANNTTGTLRQTLIEHFDGTAWTAIAPTTANNPVGTSNSLYGIKSFSATDIWAVGQASTSATQSTALIVHYDGTSWTTQTPAPGGSLLADVLPLSATDVWAAGFRGSFALIEHYNGATWSEVAMPLAPTGGSQFLNDIAGVANDIWAVGGSSSGNTLTMHYDGTGFSYVASPTPDLAASLISARYGARNDVWAVGGAAYTSPGTANELDHTVIEHWDGSTWKQVASPNPSSHQILFDVAIAPNMLLTVGFAQDAVSGAAATTLAAALCEPTPAVTALNPDHGWSSGGNPVRITGSGLLYPRSVMFGTLPATSYTINSDSMLTAVPPAQPVGSVVNVTVTTMGGTSPTGVGNQYTNFGPGPWRNNGGVLASGPAALTWGTGRLDAFVSGTDGVLYHWIDNGTFVGWEGLPGVQPTSDASAVSTAGPPTGPGVIDVFVRGSDGALWHRHYTNFSAGSWSPWEKLGGMIVGAPAAVSIGAGKIDVFVQGADNHLWLAAFDGVATWTWSSPGGVLGAPPSVISTAPDTAKAFVRGADGALWRWVTTGVWTPLGGKMLGKPAATDRVGVSDVLVEGTDAALWHWTDPSGGSIWEPVGGKLAAAPAAVSWGSSRLDVFVEGTDSALYHAWSTSSGVGAPWSWEWVGGKLVGSPAAVTWGVNRLDAFVRGADNHLWHIAFN